MIRRNFLGLDIGGGALRGVALRRQGTKNIVVHGARVGSLPQGSWALSVREPNILEPKVFAEALKATLEPLAAGEERLALSVSDPVGRVLLAEVDTAFKSKAEGIEVVKWQLKKSLPADVKDVQLDYQVLEKTETGRYRLLVSLMVRSVLQQYEEVLATAGYHAVLVDFHSLNLFNFYRSRLDFGEDFVLVGLDGGLLWLQFFQSKVLCFHRHKRVIVDPKEVFREVNLSFASIREQYPGFQRAAVFLHSDWPQREVLSDALRSLFEREIIPLDPKVERFTAATVLAQVSGQGRHLAAAIGAAERLL